MPLHDPQSVFDYQHTHVTAAALNAALELGLFFKLAGGAWTDADVAEAYGIPPGRCRAWLDVLAELGLLEAGRGPGPRAYAVSQAARTAIVESHPEIVWSFRAQRYRERYRLADNLTTTLTYPGSAWEAQGLPPPRDYDLVRQDPAWARRFTQYLYHLKAPWAEEWVAGFDLSDARRMLDLGGGSGVLSMALLRRFPALTSLVLDLEHVTAAAREIAAEAAPDLAARLTYTAGDFLADPLPGGFDFVLLADVGQHSLALFRQVRAALLPGGRLAVIAPFASAAEAVPASLASKVFQSTLEEPDYFPDTVPEAQALLAEAGFNSLPPRQLSQGFTVLEARSAPP